MAANLPEGYAEVGCWDLGRVPRWLIALLLLPSLAAMVAAAAVDSAILYLKAGGGR